ncbi:bacterial SH3 domain-containing protein [Gottschalkia purinilytica]|uniref:Bacterial SH3 domain-containing protein n=1 Tax=Gottschalkia purinilytica TaxID=1503 RepID=A0A0L0WEC7_GOTPU|nr:SH3 domain-containing protein [Gottschalkia purinilytica]KNF09791.1 bacterial SH3 domain-containing protein [Gottschalkia purinilytica]
MRILTIIIMLSLALYGCSPNDINKEAKDPKNSTSSLKQESEKQEQQDTNENNATEIIKVYEGKSTKSKVIRNINNLNEVRILADIPKGWYKIKLQDEVVGFVRKVDNQNNTQDTQQGINENNAVKNVKVYEGKSTKSRVIRNIDSLDETYILADIPEGWYKIKLQDGVVGFVRK